MKIEIDDEKKIIVIMLSHKAQADSAVQQIIDDICEQYKGTKYRIAVFYSGEQDLAENTALLLSENR